MMDWILTEFRKAPRAWSVACIIAFAFLAYANSLDSGFHYDDAHHVVGNPFVHDGKYAAQYFHRPDMFSATPRLNWVSSKSGLMRSMRSKMRTASA